MSAWWVRFDQVWKKSSTGDYLAPGNFEVRGNKNFLAPAQLVLGFGVLFQISDESKARHVKHRVQDEEERPVKVEHGSSLDSKEEEHNEDLRAQQEASMVESDDEDFPDARLEIDFEEDDEIAHDYNHENLLQTGSNNSLSVRRGPTISDEDKKIESESSSSYGSASVPDGGRSISQLQTDDKAKPSEINIPAEKGPSYSYEAQVGGEQSDSSENIADDEPEEARFKDEKDVKGKKPANASSVDPKPPSTRHVRGKRGKEKKAANKYRDQDEEDRVIAMKLLGSATGKAKAEVEAKAKQSQEEARQIQKQRRREQHLRVTREGLEHEEARRRMQEKHSDAGDLPPISSVRSRHGHDSDDKGQHATGNNDNRDAEEEQKQQQQQEQLQEQEQSMDILSNLVGTPLSGDHLLAAIPVCAPWNAMAKCKYKAKLQPGSVKKGKAVKEIMGRWLQHVDRNRKITSRVDGGGPATGNPDPGGTTVGDGSTRGNGTLDDTAEAKEVEGDSDGNGDGDGGDATSGGNKMISSETKQAMEREMERKELELIKAWRENEVFNSVPVGKVRVTMSGAAAAIGGGGGSGGKGGKQGGGGSEGGGQKKGKVRGGKGSKRDRK